MWDMHIIKAFLTELTYYLAYVTISIFSILFYRQYSCYIRMQHLNRYVIVVHCIVDILWYNPLTVVSVELFSEIATRRLSSPGSMHHHLSVCYDNKFQETWKCVMSLNRLSYQYCNCKGQSSPVNMTHSKGNLMNHHDTRLRTVNTSIYQC